VTATCFRAAACPAPLVFDIPDNEIAVQALFLEGADPWRQMTPGYSCRYISGVATWDTTDARPLWNYREFVRFGDDYRSGSQA
jgi:hypothetical protein